MAVDYSLYLVTDSTKAILGDRDLAAVVEEAIEGGVAIVQYREKTSDTGDLVRMGKRLHAITQKYNVPLLINDRVDVALAVGAEGIHIGQDDMDIHTARRLLGPDAIIGVTVCNLSEAVTATDAGASYLGIGTVFATATKTNTKTIIGTAGVRSILDHLSNKHPSIPTVAIGGINDTNIQRVLFQSKAPSKGLDGVAIVSNIVASANPKAAAKRLRTLTDTVSETASPQARETSDIARLLSKVPSVVKDLSQKSPLCHNMTNLVVQNFAANVALCIGASPIMANYGEEAADLANLGGALVVNMGTVTPDGLNNYVQAIQAYNKAKRPILLDPVGAGATAIRRNAVKTLMRSGYFTVIKGNENEIRTVWGEGTVEQQKGVDSGASTSSSAEKAALVRELAQRGRNVVLMTGATDFLSDGHRTLAIRNGHEYLGHITGSGCTLGTTIAAFLAVCEGDVLLAALAGILMFEIAAEMAVDRPAVKGPGTLVPSFLDMLDQIKRDAGRGEKGWVSLARVEMLDV